MSSLLQSLASTALATIGPIELRSTLNPDQPLVFDPRPQPPVAPSPAPPPPGSGPPGPPGAPAPPPEPPLLLQILQPEARVAIAGRPTVVAPYGEPAADYRVPVAVGAIGVGLAAVRVGGALLAPILGPVGTAAVGAIGAASLGYVVWDTRERRRRQLEGGRP